ncbi:MAG: insulinase family protein [Alphaproteobacteria bacterium]|nr:insulinase family protein [Alphaproteobacteria bacterium]
MIQPKIYKLSNGIPVIIDHLPYSESLTFGIYIKSGSRNESAPREFGISHFLEHMALKGTKTRSARDIGVAIENVGGMSNAYTTHNMTAYHATVPRAHRALAIDIISDIVQNPSFPEDEFEREKSVIIQELKSYEDWPGAVIENRMHEEIFRGGLRHDIGGTIDSVMAMTRDDIKNFYHKNYNAGGATVVISGGDIENSDKILNEIEQCLGNWDTGNAPTNNVSHYVPALSHTKKSDLSQTYFKIIWPGRPTLKRNDFRPLHILTMILGSGFSSRLFQEIREKRGLVYGISMATSAFDDTAITVIEGSTEKAKLSETVQEIAKLINAIKMGTDPITMDELNRAKEMARGALLMGLETSYRRSDYFASRSVMYGGLDDIQENINAVDAVQLCDVNAAAVELFAHAPSIITLGVEHEIPLEKWQALFRH